MSLLAIPVVQPTILDIPLSWREWVAVNPFRKETVLTLLSRLVSKTKRNLKTTDTKKKKVNKQTCIYKFVI